MVREVGDIVAAEKGLVNEVGAEGECISFL